MFFAQAHYRSPPDFTEKTLDDVTKGLERLHRLKEKLETYSTSPQKKDKTPLLSKTENSYLEAIQQLKKQFEQAMDDDFNTPQAFARLFEFVNSTNAFFEQQQNNNPTLYKQALEIYLQLCHILTLFQDEKTTTIEDDQLQNQLQQLLHQYTTQTKTKSAEESINALLHLREQARKQKEWKKADHIRKDLEDLGFEIQDTHEGPVWRKK